MTMELLVIIMMSALGGIALGLVMSWRIQSLFWPERQQLKTILEITYDSSEMSCQDVMDFAQAFKQKYHEYAIVITEGNEFMMTVYKELSDDEIIQLRMSAHEVLKANLSKKVNPSKIPLNYEQTETEKGEADKRLPGTSC